MLSGTDFGVYSVLFSKDMEAARALEFFSLSLCVATVFMTMCIVLGRLTLMNLKTRCPV